ncbi:MAG: hypothetical protein JWM25_1837 [Thermoleophilia bacterium]|nr:hypothetical protein [Thermoleophilia bacterium]MCZ4497252.1 hypothetical protein [Thermoleophilia bacterium]
MRIGRAVAVGTMAMGAYRMYRQYKERGNQPGANAKQQSGQSGFTSLFKQQRDRNRTRI